MESMPPGRSRSDSPFEGEPSGDPSLERSIGSLRALASGEFEVLGPLGRDIEGEYAFLARDLSGERLVVLKHQRPTSPGAQASLEIIQQLDASVPAPAGSCTVCHAPFTSWEPLCTQCGKNVAGSGFDAPGTPLREVLARVREAAHGYEVLGTMTRAVGAQPVFFAREISGGNVVALRLELEEGPGRRPAYTVTATRMMRSKLLHGTVGGEPDRERVSQGGASASWSPISSPPLAVPVAGLSKRAEAPGNSPDGEKVCPECRGTFGPELRFCPRDGSVLRSPSSCEDLVGRVVAERYRIVSKLGQGGMGTVYLAEHVRMGRRCAIKVMNPVLLHDPDAVNRFTREASNASRINHPHIAAIYDFGETSDEIVYLAMEFVEGESLAALLERKRGLRDQRAMVIGFQVADALSAAHELGIVHRDLKPDNVMVCESKGKPVVKVVDFGIAKATQGGSQTVTRTGFVVGTPAYMSPEQILGDPLDGRSDLYSLGCILYEMLTGERAFAGPSGEVSLRRRLTEPPPQPRKVKRALSKSLDAIVTKAMARSPEERFQSASDLRDALATAMKEKVARTGLRRWLTRAAAPETVDTADHDSVPEGPRFPDAPRLASPGFQWNSDALERPQRSSDRNSGGRTTVIRHRSARTEGWHPWWIFGGATALALAGFSIWLLPSLDLHVWESSTVSSSMSTSAEALDTSSREGIPNEETIKEETIKEETIKDAGISEPTPAENIPQLTGGDSVVRGVIRLEKALPPGARVTVDTIEAQPTAEGHLRVEPGSHRVRVRAPGFAPAARTLTVAAGDTVNLVLELARIDTAAQAAAPAGGVGPGRIIVIGKLPPGAQISIEGWPLPPGARLAEVDSGSYWVAITAPGLRPDSSFVRLGPGGQVQWSVPKLAPASIPERDTSGAAEPTSEPILPAPAKDRSLSGGEGGP